MPGPVLGDPFLGQRVALSAVAQRSAIAGEQQAAEAEMKLAVTRYKPGAKPISYLMKRTQVLSLSSGSYHYERGKEVDLSTASELNGAIDLIPVFSDADIVADTPPKAKAGKKRLW